MERLELEREIERLHDQSWGWALACCARDREAAADALLHETPAIESSILDGAGPSRTLPKGD